MNPQPSAITVRQLEYFAAAFLAGSITRAADQLYMSQPALSRQIAELERQCGVALLERTPAGVTPTPAGIALFHHARAVLRLVEASVEVARTAGPATERVALGLAPGLEPDWVARLIEACSTAMPEIELLIVDGSSTEHLRRLRDGQLDLALVHQAPAAPLAGELLRSDPMGVGLSEQAPWPGASDTIRLEELDGQRVLVHARDQASSAHDRILQAAEQAGVRPAWQVCSYIENAAAGALATRSIASIQTEASARRLLPGWRWVPLRDPEVRIETWAAHRPSNRAAVDAIRRAVRAAAA